tara:strand:+ start:928 stop:1194 length:267 start_codon:yes stop_codon:yes gene_type:complete
MSYQVQEGGDSFDRKANLGMSAKNIAKQPASSQDNPKETTEQKISNEEVMASIADLKQLITKQSIITSSKSASNTLKNMSKSSMYSRN